MQWKYRLALLLNITTNTVWDTDRKKRKKSILKEAKYEYYKISQLSRELKILSNVLMPQKSNYNFRQESL